MRKQRSILKWPGNKYLCLPHILSVFAKHQQTKRYIEPFAGSATVFLNSNFKKNFIADTNSDLILLFQQIQNNGLEFIQYAHHFFCCENNTAESYYKLRSQFNNCEPSENPTLRAALFLYLNKHGFNGLCRYNKSGIYNVPFGLYKKPYFPKDELVFFLEKTQNKDHVEFLSQNFHDSFNKLDISKQDLIYCDPPYAPIQQKTNFTQYVKNKFDIEDQICLAKYARNAALKGCTVIISNHDTPQTREIYQGSEIISFDVPRLISCRGEKRHPVKELLAIFRLKK